MRILPCAFTTVLIATAQSALCAPPTLGQQFADFSASCPTNLEKTAGYAELRADERATICTCVDRQVKALFTQQPNIDAATFTPLYRASISSCSRDGFVRKFREACIANNAAARALIQKPPLEGERRDRFCACVATELWEWQKEFKQVATPATMDDGGRKAAQICEARQ